MSARKPCVDHVCLQKNSTQLVKSEVTFYSKFQKFSPNVDKVLAAHMFPPFLFIVLVFYMISIIFQQANYC